MTSMSDIHFDFFRFADNVEYYVVFHVQSPRVFIRLFFNIIHENGMTLTEIVSSFPRFAMWNLA